MAQLCAPPHSTLQGNPGGHWIMWPLHWLSMVQSITQTPATQPPLHGPGHLPPSGSTVAGQLPDDDELDDDELDDDDEDDELDDDDDALDEDDEEAVVCAEEEPPAPASVASGSSCAPSTRAHAGAARATTTRVQRASGIAEGI